MAIGNSKFTALVFAAGFAGSLCGAAPVQGYDHISGIWKVLRAGHFSGVTNDEARVRPIKGTIAAKGRRYKFWEYDWQESRPLGRGATSLLVFEQKAKGFSYLGRYAFDGGDFRGDVHPVIRDKTVLFPYHDIEILGIKQAARILFENGPPPSALGGEFFR